MKDYRLDDINQGFTDSASRVTIKPAVVSRGKTTREGQAILPGPLFLILRCYLIAARRAAAAAPTSGAP